MDKEEERGKREKQGSKIRRLAGTTPDKRDRGRLPRGVPRRTRGVLCPLARSFQCLDALLRIWAHVDAYARVFPSCREPIMQTGSTPEKPPSKSPAISGPRDAPEKRECQGNPHPRGTQ